MRKKNNIEHGESGPEGVILRVKIICSYVSFSQILIDLGKPQKKVIFLVARVLELRLFVVMLLVFFFYLKNIY